MQRNLHDKSFDEGTLTKLDLFESYTKEWLPTFVMSQYEPTILVMDLFAGPGYSVSGQEGSPIRILRQVENQVGNIFKMKKKVLIYFNEYDKGKCQKLKEACDEYCNSHEKLKRAIESGYVKYSVYNKDVALLFPRVKDKFLNKFPILLFLDQNGIKFMSDAYFKPLLLAKKVDFLFYVSSSYIVRFGNTEELKIIIDIDMEKAKASPYKYIHKEILVQLKERIPQQCKTRLYPFTIKKGSNVYGIIFGASHPKGVEKFLTTAWKENSTNGEANFDIDDDCNKGHADLFGHVEFTKMMKFEKDLTDAILAKAVKTNKDAYDFALEHGHLPKHASHVIKKLKKLNKVSFESKSPLVSYDKVYKEGRVINYITL